MLPLYPGHLICEYRTGNPMLARLPDESRAEHSATRHSSLFRVSPVVPAWRRPCSESCLASHPRARKSVTPQGRGSDRQEQRSHRIALECCPTILPFIAFHLGVVLTHRAFQSPLTEPLRFKPLDFAQRRGKWKKEEKRLTSVVVVNCPPAATPSAMNPSNNTGLRFARAR